MIDRGTADALSRITQRSNDLLHAYRSGFEPETRDAAADLRPVRVLDPLSVAAPEGAYFLSRGPDGATHLSRDGGFAVRGGLLVDGQGAPVLGYAPGGSTGGVPGAIRVDAVDAALGRVRDARIEADGSVAYTRTAVDPRSGARRDERVVAGRLALARFPAGTAPIRVDATHVEAPRGVAPALGVATDGTFGALSTFARDVGRLDLTAGLQRLQEAYQSFEAMRAAHSARGAVDKTTMDLVK